MAKCWKIWRKKLCKIVKFIMCIFALETNFFITSEYLVLRTEKLYIIQKHSTILNGFLNTYQKTLLKDACQDHRPLDTDFFVRHMASPIQIQHFGLDINVRSTEMDCHMLDPAQKAISHLSINLIIWLGFPKRTPTFIALKAQLPPLPLLRCWFWADRHDMRSPWMLSFSLL